MCFKQEQENENDVAFVGDNTVYVVPWPAPTFAFLKRTTANERPGVPCASIIRQLLSPTLSSSRSLTSRGDPHNDDQGTCGTLRFKSRRYSALMVSELGDPFLISGCVPERMVFCTSCVLRT